VTDAATTLETDILIIGAGPVGMTLALALEEGRGARRVLLVDSKPRGNFVNDPRALALSHGTRQLLESLHAWNASAGTPIRDIHVSQSGGFGRTVITREEQGVEALGYVMRYRDLAAGLNTHLPADSILDSSEVVATNIGAESVIATIRRNGIEQRIHTQLIVHAEGTSANAADVSVRDYHQHAVLAEVRPEPAHGHRAWERFTPDGPLALLPLGEDYSVVFTVPPEKADLLMQMNDAAFLAALQQQFGTRLRFTATSPRARYPLALRLRKNLCTREKSGSAMPLKHCTRFPGRGSIWAFVMRGNWPKSCLHRTLHIPAKCLHWTPIHVDDNSTVAAALHLPTGLCARSPTIFRRCASREGLACWLWICAQLPDNLSPAG
jgi:2-polyprenyl-6-methoxyphenol hydroxylase-like FAD-dependent oxidoreductase